MKMSEAILLGYPEIGHTNAMWLRPKLFSEGWEGCAIGAALYAMGERSSGMGLLESYWDKVAKLWPWTMKYRSSWSTILPGTVQFMADVTHKYEKVIQGKETIEQLVDWVRAVEAKYEPGRAHGRRTRVRHRYLVTK